MTDRRHMSLRVKLDACLYALGIQPGQEDWHHEPPLGLRPRNSTGDDYEPAENDPRHIIPVLSEEHKRQTFGDPAIPLSGDVSKIAKTKRIEEKYTAFRQRIIASDGGGATFLPGSKPKRKWPSRPFPTKRRIK